MPKLATSSSRRLRAQPVPSTAAVRHSPIFAAAPRKVSFEDGHHSSSSLAPVTSCSTSCSSIASSLSSSKSSLRRKAPSVCLVGLAASGPQEEVESHCLSPTPIAAEQHATAPSSPWGHFVDILVPLDEEDQPATKRRLLGDDAPLFGFFDSEEQDSDSSSSSSSSPSWIPSLVDSRKLKNRRRWGAPHPYALQPRHHRRQQRRRSNTPTTTKLKPSFLPGFFIEGDRTTESSETREVEQALGRMQV